jgi:hypothetical protein
MSFAGSSVKPARNYGIGRVCASSNCDTRLSRYNSSEHCAIHGPPPGPEDGGASAGLRARRD